jgi:putative ABC transport system permease protein
MNNSQLLTMGYRNLWLHRHRQLFLFLALTLCFSLISLLTLVSQGMSRNVYASSRIHYGGDLFLSGFDGDNRDKPARVENPQELLTLTNNLPGLPAKRTLLFKNTYLYFNGKPQLIKNTVGLDYEVEKSLLAHYEIEEGSLEPLGDSGNLALSSSLASLMGITLGDQVTLKTTNHVGQINTGDFTVTALINDSTLLGYYRLFMNRTDLNGLLGLKADAFNSLGVYLNQPTMANEESMRLQKEMARMLPTAGPILTRGDYYHEMGQAWKGVRYFSYPLSMYISDVDDLLRALDLVSYFIYLMMLLITFVSVLVTYRIILHDRSRELAVLQSMGMMAGQVESMLIMEALLLLGLSLAAGFLLSLLFLGGLGFVSFEAIQGFGIFLKRGKLTGTFSLGRFLVNICVILLGVLPAVWLQVRHELNRPLALTLKGEK